MLERPQITLYFCHLIEAELTEATKAILQSWLPQDETDKVNRYIKQSAKEQGLLVRGFLRALLSKQVSHLLSQQANLQPDEWRFKYGEKGKPRLSDEQFLQTGLHFNLSHSGDWLVVGICELQGLAAHSLEFGVDIERCRSSTNIHSILSHYFSEPEQAALLALPQELQRARFFDLWALKESYIKAKGSGLALSLKSFAFDFSSLIETSIELDVTQSLNYTAASKGRSDIQQLPCKHNIGLSLQQASDDKQAGNDPLPQLMRPAKDWHCWLGDLDDSYRFAVSVGQCQQASIKAKLINLPSLLASL
ncbi:MULTISPECIES: 4'-phosphopantetheinyl transferase superfamily protein [unclassified Shewanella]|uniref:4'-phosphopantetheinyl transferase family protein n=1 Tax=unclassified Shewanella TaxID=196818 RepID=UPI001BB9D906|nr:MULTISPECIES: 4'-phosphopantetheinyl transferase superfamily protein [unclassified Shewanella]GIU16660.1 4'-phosphopantetheinyl transferase [Shewanella sp. MBTL60-112-B1]GIU35776.1 4'-phosphopantetheinyl transferase [Shewanella sp. MBTL60-112-B2]